MAEPVIAPVLPTVTYEASFRTGHRKKRTSGLNREVDSTSDERSDASIPGSLFNFDPLLENVLPALAPQSEASPEDITLTHARCGSVVPQETTEDAATLQALFDEPLVTVAPRKRHTPGRSAAQKRVKTADRAPRAAAGRDAAPSRPPDRVRSRASPEVQRVTVRKVPPSYVQQSQMSPAKKKLKGSRLRACRQSKKRCTNLETFAQEHFSLPKLLAWCATEGLIPLDPNKDTCPDCGGQMTAKNNGKTQENIWVHCKHSTKCGHKYRFLDSLADEQLWLTRLSFRKRGMHSGFRSRISPSTVPRTPCLALRFINCCTPLSVFEDRG